MGLGSEIRDPRSGIRKTLFRILDPGSGSRGQKGTGSRIRIRNTAPKHKLILTMSCRFKLTRWKFLKIYIEKQGYGSRS